MKILLQANQLSKIIDDAIRLLDEAPWYVYFIVVIVIVLLLLIKPILNHRKKINTVNNLSENPQNAKLIDRNIFVRVNQKNISKNKIEEVIKNIENFAISINDERLSSQIVHLSSRFKEEQNLFNTGRKDLANTIEMNRIKYSLIEILNETLKD